MQADGVMTVDAGNACNDCQCKQVMQTHVMQAADALCTPLPWTNVHTPYMHTSMEQSKC